MTGDQDEGGPPARRPVVAGLVRYLRAPRSSEPHDGSSRRLTALKLLGLDLLCAIPLIGVTLAGEALIGGEGYVGDEGLLGWEIALLAVVVAPLIEEPTFRLAVTRFRPAYAIVSGALLTLVMLDPGLGPTIIFVLPALAVVALGIAGATSPGRRERIGAWWERRFAWVFYGSAIGFGMVHLTNFSFGEVGAAELVAAPLLVAPQAVGGLILGYTRVRLGMWYAIAMHAGFNTVITLPVLFA